MYSLDIQRVTSLSDGTGKEEGISRQFFKIRGEDYGEQAFSYIAIKHVKWKDLTSWQFDGMFQGAEQYLWI